MTERLKKLSLNNPLTYKREDFGLNDAIKNMLLAETGSDAFVKYSFAFSDAGATFTRMDSGFKTPLSPDEKERIESGLTPMVRDDENTSIPSGAYIFEQYPDLAEESGLTVALSSILGARNAENVIYIRLYKENALELVMQAFRPLISENI